MSVPLILNGVTYTIPTVGETSWGQNTTSYLVALGSGGLLALSGGAFTLTSDVNFGPNFGIASPYFGSGAAGGSGTGVLRLTNTESVVWRNSGNTGDLVLNVVGNALTFDGAPIGTFGFPRTTVIGTTVTMVTGNQYTCTNVAAVTATLPPSPSEGNVCLVVFTNGLTTNLIDPGANTIGTPGVSGVMTCDIASAPIQLQYLNGGWRFIV